LKVVLVLLKLALVLLKLAFAARLRSSPLFDPIAFSPCVKPLFEALVEIIEKP